MEHTPTVEESGATLEQLEKDAAALAAKEHLLQLEIAKAKEEMAKTTIAPESKIHHGYDALNQVRGVPQSSEEVHPDGPINIALHDFSIPAVPYDLSRANERHQYDDRLCMKFLEQVTHGAIKERVLKIPRAEASALIVLLEGVRTAERQRFATYVELPINALVGQPADELERKLFLRHFRNKEAQHRVFMIGFSVAVFCVIGALLTDIFNEGDKQLVMIAAIIGAATTALGIIGHLIMRIGDGRSEKHAARMIQELMVLDHVLDNIRIAVR